MSDSKCPKIEKCPLFNGQLLKRKGSEDSYKNLFCTAGKQKWSACKRYQTAEKVGKCADWILPNCSMSLDEIVSKMKLKGELV
jgi:hypothetical protein